MTKVLVFGSANIDFLAQINKMPDQGETIKSEYFTISFGGKGANQAIAAAKAGAKVTFVGAVGDDNYGNLIIDNLQAYGINCQNIQTIPNKNTGMAMVLLHNKDNRIIINSGANDSLVYTSAFDQLIADHQTILLQNEIPLAFNNSVIKKARELGKTIIFNPAPAENLAGLNFAAVDFLTPNEHEFELLTELKVSEIDKKAIVTLGEKGAKYKEQYFATEKVNVVDTTGAGDTFNGAFAASLTQTNDLTQAIKKGLVAATKSVTYLGAQHQQTKQ